MKTLLVVALFIFCASSAQSDTLPADQDLPVKAQINRYLEEFHRLGGVVYSKKYVDRSRKWGSAVEVRNADSVDKEKQDQFLVTLKKAYTHHKAKKLEGKKVPEKVVIDRF